LCVSLFFYKSIGVLERVEPGTQLRVGFLKSSDLELVPEIRPSSGLDFTNWDQN
jgi:hypothetical protein